MKALLIPALLFAATPVAALADDFRHPAIAAPAAQPAGYDYAAKFYPHPAWLHLLAEAPRPLGEHPAVLVFKRQQREQLRQRHEIAQELIARAAAVAPEAALGR